MAVRGAGAAAGADGASATVALNDANPPFYKWFEDGELNLTYNCLDRHVEAGGGDKVAYTWIGEPGAKPVSAKR